MNLSQQNKRNFSFQSDFSEVLSESGARIVDVDGTFLHFTDNPLSPEINILSSMIEQENQTRYTPNYQINGFNSSDFDNSMTFRTIKPKNKNSPLNSPQFHSIRYSPQKTRYSQTLPSRQSISPLPDNETEQMFTVYDSNDGNSEYNINNITNKYISKIPKNDEFQSPVKIPSGSPIMRINNNKSYNLDNLPSDAFGQPIEEEEEITPLILNLPLPQRIAVKDTESDTEMTQLSFTKEEFINYVGQDIAKLLNSRLFKQRIKGLNKIQGLLQSEEDLDNVAELFFLGISQIPGFKESNTLVNQLMIDIIRHIITKAENITKSVVYMILPYLVEKGSDTKLKKSIFDLDLMISEAICPNFMILQLLEIASSKKNQKTIASVLEITLQILDIFGPGDLDLNHYLPLLTTALSSSNSEVKKYAMQISKYLYKKFGEIIQNISEKLSSAVKSHFLNELQNAPDINNPKKNYFRQRASTTKIINTNKAEKAPMKITDIITNDQCTQIMTSSKFAEHKFFLQSVENAIEACHNKIQSNDLEIILKSLQFLAANGNQNIVALSLVVMRKLAESADPSISKFANYAAEAVIGAWGDQRQSLREAATDTAVSYKNTAVFVKSILSVKSLSSGMRLEIFKYIERMSNELQPSDLAKLVPIIFSSIDDKSPNVRTKALSAASIVRSITPDVYQQNFEKASRDIQKKLNQISSPTKPKQEDVKSVSSAKSEPKKEISPKSEKSTKQVVETKLSIITDQDKKDKRLANLLDILNNQNISEKAKNQKIAESTKNDSQIIFPHSIFKGLFSTTLAEQIVSLGNISALLKTDRLSIELCSDVFVRYFSIKVAEKQVKLVQIILQILNDIFSSCPITIIELKFIIPQIFLCYENLSELSPECDDLLFLFRVNCDVKTLSEIYISLIPKTPNSLHIILAELSYLLVHDINILMQLFVSCSSLLNHENESIRKSAGALLSSIASQLSDSERESFVKDINGEQKEKIAKYFPVASNSFRFSFAGFSTMDKVKKLQQTRLCVKALRENNDVYVDLAVSELLDFFLEEELDWVITKSLLFSLSEVVGRGKVQKDGLERLFSVICFFANRRQRQIIAVDGLSTLIGAICFRIASRLSARASFGVIYDGMVSFCLAVTPECFYAKLWTALLLQFEHVCKGNPDDAEDCYIFASEKLDGADSEKLLSKLLQALADTAYKLREESFNENIQEDFQNNEHESILETTRHISPIRNPRKSLPSRIPQFMPKSGKSKLQMASFEQLSIAPSESQQSADEKPMKKKSEIPKPNKSEIPKPNKKAAKKKSSETPRKNVRYDKESSEDDLPINASLKETPQSVKSLIHQLEMKTPKSTKSNSPPIILSSVKQISPRNPNENDNENDVTFDNDVEEVMHTPIEIPNGAFAEIFAKVSTSPPRPPPSSSLPSTPFLDHPRDRRMEIPIPPSIAVEVREETLSEFADEENTDNELPFPHADVVSDEEAQFLPVSAENSKSGLSDVVGAISGVLRKWNEESISNI